MRGTVLAVSGDTVTLSPGKLTGCFGCMRQECKNRQHIVTAVNPLALPLAVGQTVEVHTPKPDAVRQTLTALVPLPAGFLAGFLLAGVFFPQSGEALRVGAGVGGLFAAGGGMYFLRKRFPAETLPQVTGVCDAAPLPAGAEDGCGAD